MKKFNTWIVAVFIAVPFVGISKPILGDKSINSSLVSFESHLNGERVDIKWETKNQKNIASFFIEKSKDGITFESLCEVSAGHTSTSYMDYLNVDYDVWEGKTYYRIVEKDVFGTTLKSNIVAVVEKKKKNHKAVDITERTVSLDGLMGAFEEEEKFENESLVVVRNRKGEEMYSNIQITANDGNAYTGFDVEEYIPEGKYRVIATNDDRLFGKKLRISKW